LLLDAVADGDEDPSCVTGALDGLKVLAGRHAGDRVIRDRAFSAVISALERHDVAVTTTAAGMLGDTLFRRPESVAPLVAMLESLRPPDDTEALQEIISTLGKLGDARAFEPLQRHLQSADPAVAVAAADALRLMTGNDYSSQIRRRTEPLFQDLDFDYLRRLAPLPRIRLSTTRGEVEIELNTHAAPFTVMSMLKLASQRGYFRGLTFHRVVPNFVVQGGDPRGDGWGGPGYSIRSEFSPLAYETGTVGMASAGKDTEGSQFFITHSPQPHLDGRYTIIGRVVGGMDVVDALQVDDRIYDIQPIE
jgi:cyclophilin family peptidyl-prolyl cis-trans isomerase